MSSEATAAEHPLPSGYTISTDPTRLDLDYIHRWLSEDSYWSRGVSRDVVERALAGSLPFGLYDGDGRQVGLVRVVTDRATFAWIADVFIAASARRRGLGKALVAAVIAHPDLQGLRRIMLATRDAHGFYAQFGFTPPIQGLLMEKLDPAALARLRGDSR